jgi:multidrug efflux system outer membrane protein
LRLLPGITLSVSPNYDSNSFLVNHNWVTGSAQLAGYLSNLLTAPTQFRRADENVELSARRREAVGMAVLAKLHIAYEQYLSAASEYRWATQLSDVDQRLYQQIANRAATDVQGDLERVSAQVSEVFSLLRRYQSYAETQAALGRLYAALGIDPPPAQIEELDIDAVDQDVNRVLADSSLAVSNSDSQASVPAGNAPQQAVAQQSVAAAPAGDASAKPN